MATTMKDLEQRLDAVERRLDEVDARGTTPGGSTLPEGESAPDRGRGGDLETRVARLENLTGHRLPDHADRVAADKRLVARFVNSREEAMAQQAARERLAALGVQLEGEPSGADSTREDEGEGEDAPAASAPSPRDEE